MLAVRGRGEAGLLAEDALHLHPQQEAGLQLRGEVGAGHEARHGPGHVRAARLALQHHVGREVTRGRSQLRAAAGTRDGLRVRVRRHRDLARPPALGGFVASVITLQ